MVSRFALLGALVLVVGASLTLATVAMADGGRGDDRDDRITQRCADQPSPERCEHRARHGGTDRGETDRSHERVRAHCAQHPDDDRCQRMAAQHRSDHRHG